MLFLAALLTAQFLLGAPEPGDLSAQRGARPGKLLWQGLPDALRRTPGELPFDLAPDGRHLLYLQGDPWPRVMVQPIDPSAGGKVPEPFSVGGVEPYGERAPCFDLKGRSVFFTADSTPRRSEASSPFHRAPRTSAGAISPEDPLKLAVVRAPLDGHAVEVLLPALGSSPAESAVLLDLHPGGRTILVGSASGLKSNELAGGASLALSELDLTEDGKPAGPPRPLSFSVDGGALVRYSWDGTSIYFSDGPKLNRSASIFRYGRATFDQEATGLEASEVGWLAGDVEVRAVLLPHPGSFGWDGFRLHLLSRSSDGPEIPFLPEDSSAGSLPLFPVSVRGNRILLAGGLEDRRVLAVSSWDAGAFESEISRASRSPGPPGRGFRSRLPGYSAGEVLARGEDPRAANLLGRLRSSQVFLPGQPLRAVRAKWTLRGVPPARMPETDIDATEFVTGELWVERTRKAAKEGAPPSHEVLAFDGKKAWFTDAGGGTTFLDRSEFLIQTASASPLRLLIDPAGLGFPWLSFRSAGDGPPPGAGGGPGRVERLEIRSPDGWRATLRLSVEEDRTLPAGIEFPLLFPEERMLRGNSRTTREVAFEDYRSVGGRLLPGRIRFDDGIEPFELFLVEAELNPETAAKLFR